MYTDKLISGNDNLSSLYDTLLAEPTGYTIARTAKILGMSKQAVDKAIISDRLHATRIYAKTGNTLKLLSTEVCRDSVIALANHRSGHQRGPKGFKASQIPLAI